MPIKDTSNVPVSALAFEIEAPGASFVQTLRIDVPLNQSYRLRAAPAAAVSVLVRKTGDASFTDIAQAPLDLSPYGGQQIEIELKIEAGNISQIESLSFEITGTQ